MKNLKLGYAALEDNTFNKSTGFTYKEREALSLRGLLPYRITSQETQAKWVLENLERKSTDIERYLFLSALQERNERLFYHVLNTNVDKIMPLVYTPTVGHACKEFGLFFRKPKGFYITPEDKGQIKSLLNNWPKPNVKVIVVTDGERILGLGDLGANGMGIPIGKLALYVACAGIHPDQCMPIVLDVGTNNEELRNNPHYLGYPYPRLAGEDYDSLVEEFMTAVTEKFPGVLVQFEDFSTPNAYVLLNRYRDNVLSFNDDIQGTAAVALAGIFAASKATGIEFQDLKFLFLGAGSASTGIGHLIVSAMMEMGLTQEEARAKLWFVDPRGLIVKGRERLKPHNEMFAHDAPAMDFLAAIDHVKPNVLIGATGAPGTFSQDVIEKMAQYNEQPVIFALSNPTSRAECTAEDAYKWSNGKALFASGSPFSPVTINGKVRHPGQGNNVYIFPGVGLGALACEAKIITDEMFLVAAKALAEKVTPTDIEDGTLYPRIARIRDISLHIAKAVIEKAIEQGLAQKEIKGNIDQHLISLMYDPKY